MISSRKLDISREHFMQLLLLSHFGHVRLCDPIDGSPPGSSVHRTLQARILEWVAISSSTFHAKAGTIKDRKSTDLTEAEKIKKRWQEYTE